MKTLDDLLNDLPADRRAKVDEMARNLINQEIIRRHVGDKSKAICEKCEKMVTTTFGIHEVPFSDDENTTVSIMAGTCDECEMVIAIPAQSTPAIKEALEELRKLNL